MMYYKMIATCAGIGKIKGGGTIAAALYTILWWFIRPSIDDVPAQVVVFLLITAVACIRFQ